MTDREGRPMDWQPFFMLLGGLIILAIGGAIGWFVSNVYAASKDGNESERRPTASLSDEDLRKLGGAQRVEFGESPRSPRMVADSPSAHALREDDTQAITAVKTVRAGRLLTTPPTINGVTLRDHLTHHATRKCPHEGADGRALHSGTWPCVVEDMYDVALQSPLAHYFEDTDLVDLKRHFLAALVTVTHVGLTVATADRLEAAHAHLGITGEDYDAVVQVLVQSLGTYVSPDVLAHVAPQLTPTFAELRKRLVAA